MQTLTGVYSGLQKKAYSWVSFFTKFADWETKKRLHQRFFPVSLPNITEFFFVKHVWAVTASAKYHSFSLMHRPHQQYVTLDLGYILIIFKYFQSKHCESLVNSCFWKSYTISWFFADKSSNTSKMFLEIRSSRPAVFFKTYLKSHKKASVMKLFFS